MQTKLLYPICVFFFLKIIKVKRQALEDEDSPENDNDKNARMEDDLYNDALRKFPELHTMDKQEVLRQMKMLSVNRPEVKQEEDIPTRKIFIDHVLCNETKFNDDEVRDHVYTIVAAGSETTALQTAHTSEKLMQIEVVKLVNLYFRYSLSYAARDAPRDPGKSLRRVEGSFLLGWYRNHLRQHHEAGLLRENHQRVVAALSGCTR